MRADKKQRNESSKSKEKKKEKILKEGWRKEVSRMFARFVSERDIVDKKTKWGRKSFFLAAR